MTVIIDCLGGHWTPAFGDRGVQAWITVLAYLACGFLAVAVWRGESQPVLRRFWGFVAMLMLFLAVNKQLDLQTALTETGRCLSLAQGWHGYRRYVQVLFILILGVIVLLTLYRGARMMRGHLSTHGMALVGTALVGGYVMIRATSFHYVDMIGGRRVLGLSANFLLENVGLVLISLNAIRLLRQRRPRKPPRQTDRPAVTVQGAAALRPMPPSRDGGMEGPADEHRPFQPLKPRGH
ncbi:MAG: hypothetical protein ACK5IP_16360 [Paracoccus sp. (in: a-proteobacteria)]